MPTLEERVEALESNAILDRGNIAQLAAALATAQADLLNINNRLASAEGRVGNLDNSVQGINNQINALISQKAEILVSWIFLAELGGQSWFDWHANADPTRINRRIRAHDIAVARGFQTGIFLDRERYGNPADVNSFQALLLFVK